MTAFLYKFRLLPAMLVVACLAFVVRAGDFVIGLNSMGAAHAQQEVRADPPPMNVAQSNTQEIEGRLDLGAEGSSLQVKPEFQEPANDIRTAQQPVGGGANWRDAGDTEIEGSALRDEVHQDLSRRRELLDRKEKEIAVREALLSAAERELDQKLRELTTLRTEIEASMKKRSEEEEARITSLVKIYEGMKPKDAASILNTLDLDVLLEIMTRMSERKSSPIMAEMNPERARTLTVLMSEKRRQPVLPDLH